MDQASIDAILAGARDEFIDTAMDKLGTMDDLITKMIDDAAVVPECMVELRRDVHSLKGQGGTFDFPAITMIAHDMEDYIQACAAMGSVELKAIQTFIDAVRDILEQRENPSDAETHRILARLPVPLSVISANQSGRVIRVLVVTEIATQRTILARELTSCGFQVTTAESAVQAIDLCLTKAPDIVVADRTLRRMGGPELMRVLAVMGATKASRRVIVTGTETADADLADLPPETAVVHKSGAFHEELTQCLMDWGFFGEMAES